MPTRLSFTLDPDGTVTLRCDAAAFFAHVDELTRLLGGETGSPVQAAQDGQALRASVGRLVASPDGAPRPGLSRRGEEVLVAAWHLTRRGLPAFRAPDLVAALQAAGMGSSRVGAALVQLARVGWVERVRRGRYVLTPRARERLDGLLQEPREPRARRRRPRRRAPPATPLPDLSGLARFLRDVPTSRKWRRVLLVAYFLQVHCGLPEVDQRLVAACFRRVRGQPAPGSLAAVISQVLYKRRGLLERGTRRGSYRLTPAALEELRLDPRLAEADAARPPGMARTG